METHAAVDHSDQSAGTWTDWIRERVRIEDIAVMDSGDLAPVQAKVAKFAAQAIVRPHRIRPPWLTEARLRELNDEADLSLRGDQRFTYHGRYNVKLVGRRWC